MVGPWSSVVHRMNKQVPKMLGNSEVHATQTSYWTWGRNGCDLGPGSPHCHSLSLSPTSPTGGAAECPGDETGASPALALRCPQMCCSPGQGLPSSSGLEPLHAAEAALSSALGSLQQSSPWKSSTRSWSCKPGQHYEADAYLALQDSTHSAESTRGCNTRRCPQFPELMSQFSFSIST